MNALITGAAGQDGWYVSELLGRRGQQFVACARTFDDFPADHPAHRFGTAVTLDITDARAIEAVIREHQPDVIFHLAGATSVAESWEAPGRYAAVNVGGTANLLEVIHRQHLDGLRAPKLIHASSGEIFDLRLQLPSTAQSPILPHTPYGVTKAAAHFMVQIYRDRGLNAVNAVLFNHESELRPATFVTGKIVREVAKISAGLTDKLVLGNIAARRDWLHASDVAAGLVAIADADAEGDYVIASGVSRSVGDFAAAAFRWVGIENWRDYVEIDQSLLRTNDSPDSCGDASALTARTGWRPHLEFDDWVGEMVQHALNLRLNP